MLTPPQCIGSGRWGGGGGGGGGEVRVKIWGGGWGEVCCAVWMFLMRVCITKEVRNCSQLHKKGLYFCSEVNRKCFRCISYACRSGRG